MAKLFVIAGHGAGDAGACSDGYTEADLVRQLATRLGRRGGSDVQIGDTNVNWYASDYITKGKCPSGVPVVELHMDGVTDTTACGGHVIIKSGMTADTYDNNLANFISSFAPGRSQKIVGRSDLANPNRASKMGVNYRLLECGFITNDDDRNRFISRMDELADGILSVFGINSNGSSSAPVVSTPSTSDDKYSLKIDGIPGKYTYQALQEFLRTQKNSKGELCYGTGLNIDGVPGYWTYLAWQEFLRAKGFYGDGLALDGIYGYYTKLAAQEWLRTEKNLDGELCYGLGYALDGVDGVGFYTALQECLRAKGFYN